MGTKTKMTFTCWTDPQTSGPISKISLFWTYSLLRTKNITRLIDSPDSLRHVNDENNIIVTISVVNE